MPYKFLILDTYYPEFLNDLYRDNVDLAYSSYHAQKESLLAQAFGTGDFYSKNLQILGCEAEEIIANNFALQAKWAEENRVFYSNLLFKLSKLRKIGRFFPSPNPLYGQGAN